MDPASITILPLLVMSISAIVSAHMSAYNMMLRQAKPAEVDPAIRAELDCTTEWWDAEFERLDTRALMR